MQVIAMSQKTMDIIIAGVRYWQEKDCAYHLWYEQFASEPLPVEEDIDMDINSICEGEAFDEHKLLVLLLIFSAVSIKEITIDKGIELSGMSKDQFMTQYKAWSVGRVG